MKQTSFSINGMHCQSCEVLLTDVLSDVPGVEEAKVSLKSESATVKFDPAKVSEHDLRKAVEAEGYKTS